MFAADLVLSVKKRTIACISFDGGENPLGSHDTESEILQLLMTTVTWLCERGGDFYGVWVDTVHSLPIQQNSALVHQRLKICGVLLKAVDDFDIISGQK